MRRQGVILLALSTLLFSLSAFPSPSPARADGDVAMRAAKGTLRAPIIKTNSVTRTAPALSPGVVIAAADELREEEADAASGDDRRLSVSAPVAGSSDTLGCSERHKGKANARVNQDCSFRRQAEEGIAFNPTDRDNLVAGQNDSRVGFNQCGIAWSTNNGADWGDLLPPFRQKVNNPMGELPTADDPNSHTLLGDPGTGHTYDAASDPGVAFDSQGNAFFDCVAFDVTSNASMLYVVVSPADAHGSFFFNVPTLSRHFIVVEDNNPGIFHDKPFLAADVYPESPNRDNVYVTWTVFRFSSTCGTPQFCSSPIFGSMSTDHGRTWSTPEEISGTSDALCFVGNLFDPTRNPHACDFDQGSDLKVLPNGDLAVIFSNANTAPTNRNAQYLGVHCHPTGSSPAGTAHFNCGAPSKVGDDIVVGEPQCDFGRGPEECIPGAYIRTNDFPRLAVNRRNGDLYATWQDYRKGEYDIQLARSRDGGLTWTAMGTVNPDRGLDHYFPAIDLAERATEDRVGDSYYRTERVPNENATPAAGFAPCGPAVVNLGASTTCQPGVGAGNSDYVLAGGQSRQTPYDFTVVSPVFPPPDGIESGFNGDYSGLTITTGTEAHPIWSDTRDVNPFPENGVAHDEDIFTDDTQLPSGQASLRRGEVGER
jgi:hypothetical protein